MRWNDIENLFLLSLCDRSAKMHFHGKQNDRQNVLVIITDMACVEDFRLFKPRQYSEHIQNSDRI